jgi:hypothetical protein
MPWGRAKIIDDGHAVCRNIVPSNRISPQAQALVGSIRCRTDGGAHYNYRVPLVASTHSDAVQGRINKAIGRKNNINGSAG